MPDIARLAGPLAGRYDIIRQIGHGGMATVFLARDVKHDREVAIKVLHPDLAAAVSAERFHREVRILAKLRHPHVVPLLDSGEADGLLYYIMPFVDGETLRQRLASGPLPVDEALRLWRDVVDGIAYAHRHGIAHRDIKPENVLISDRHGMVADFGIAKALTAGAAHPANDTPPQETLTSVGVAIGTPAYMSPEQVAGSDVVDHRSDIYALGVLAYEMLSGKAPFRGTTPQSVFAAQITETPPPIEDLRPEIPPSLAAAIQRCMQKDPALRWRSADELLAELERFATPQPGAYASVQARRLGRGAIAGIAAGVLLVAAGGYAMWSRQARVRWATETGLPELRRLTDARRTDSAFVLAAVVQQALPDNAEVDTLMRRNTILVGLRSEPAGARVSWASYARDSLQWTPLGVTPFDSVVAPVSTPSVLILLRVEKDGHAPSMLPVNAAAQRAQPLTVALAPADDSGMVRVIAATAVVADGAGGTRTVQQAAFAIDRYEVTNAQFRRFVDAGGYANRALWEPFVSNGRPLSWDDGIRRLTDGTGRPGPASWEGGAPTAGQEQHPVTGVSWYEAAAYAKFVGKSLPTVHQWRTAAGLNRSALITPLSNSGSQGLLPVGAPRGMGPFGTFDMAGNAREWCLNADGPRRYILGGSWTEAPWQFTHAAAEDPFDRKLTNGFRLVRVLGAEADAALLAGNVSRGVRDYSRERPRPESDFRTFRTLFAYDDTPLNARVESVDSSDASVIRQTISYDAAYPGERIRLQLVLPRGAKPPYQTVVFVPGANAFGGGSSAMLLQYLPFVATNGRAVAYPVLRSMLERTGDVNYSADAVHNMSGGLLGPNTYRDEVLMQVKDVRRTLDYLSSRRDIDTTRIAYSGLSWGGRMAPIMTSVEPRFKLAILYTPGLLTAPRLPQVDDVNYLPYMRIPTLILSGRYDDVFPLQTMVMPYVQLLGTPKEHLRHVVYETQHFVPRAEQIAETLNWLDRYFGPVARR